MNKIMMFICLVGMNQIIHGMEYNKYKRSVKMLEDEVKERIEFGLIREEAEDDVIENCKNAVTYYVAYQNITENFNVDPVTQEKMHVAIDHYLQTYKKNSYESRSSDCVLKWIIKDRIKRGRLVMDSNGHLVENEAIKAEESKICSYMFADCDDCYGKLFYEKDQKEQTYRNYHDNSVVIELPDFNESARQLNKDKFINKEEAIKAFNNIDGRLIDSPSFANSELIYINSK
jgi:hypothetical protein